MSENPQDWFDDVFGHVKTMAAALELMLDKAKNVPKAAHFHLDQMETLHYCIKDCCRDFNSMLDTYSKTIHEGNEDFPDEHAT